MKNVKMPTSKSYHEFLIDSLQDSQEAASYISAFFEEQDPESELLKLVLNHVLEALTKSNTSPETVREQKAKLDEILSQPGSEAIYNLANWLKVLGLKLQVVPESDRS
jgi:DNA-binding phage protein